MLSKSLRAVHGDPAEGGPEAIEDPALVPTAETVTVIVVVVAVPPPAQAEAVPAPVAALPSVVHAVILIQKAQFPTRRVVAIMTRVLTAIVVLLPKRNDVRVLILLQISLLVAQPPERSPQL